jgi:L-ascorbate metabolism protein UlaG (beta-lactamase superfamily)
MLGIKLAMKIFKNHRFQNKNPTKNPLGFFAFLKWKWTSKPPQWPQSVAVHAYDHPPATVEGSPVRISFVGHVTFLIQTQSLNILTDPVWSARTSPFSNIGPKRVTEPGIKFEDLPKIDLILISHNHYDHMDIDTLCKLWHRDKPRIIVPLKNDTILDAKIPGIKVETLDWHESTTIQHDISVHLEPSQHWSRRGFYDLNKALWGTFIIRTTSGSICFIGDSGYDPTIFKDIGNKFDILVSLIPIGCYEPRWFMKDVHMNPEESVFVHQDLKSNYSIASHFETFHLAGDGFKQAALDLEQARQKYHISNEAFITPIIGGTYWFNRP